MACFHPNMIKLDNSTNPRTRLAYVNSRKKNFSYEWFQKENELAKEMGWTTEWIQVPCKKCVGCQERYSKEWAIRCILEAGLHNENWFITLTYDDYNLPCESEIINKKTGEIFIDDGSWQTGHLVEDHVKQFMDHLRDYWEYHYHWQGIKFYGAGEYGSQTLRPHYHILLFNLPIPKELLKVYHINKDGSIYWTCDLLSKKIWIDPDRKIPRGHVVLAKVNWDTCAYTARYVMKKLKRHEDEWYYNLGQTPEFVRMSNRPGIASEVDYEKYFLNDEIIYKGHRESISVAKPPEYFARKFAIMHPDDMQIIREKRKEICMKNMENKMTLTDKSIKEQLETEERLKINSWKSLQRNKI